MSTRSEQLRSVTNFDELVRYLEDELDWPLQEYGFDELTFEYQPEELGLREEDAAKVRRIHQLRPLWHGQPWGIFFVEFESKRLPVVVMRRILSHLVVKKRAAANRANAAAWDASDLLFISAFGPEESAQREVAFAHFHQEAGDLPTLRVLGWDGGDTPLKLEHVAATLGERLRWPDDPTDSEGWRAQWSGVFQHRQGHVIRTADALAEQLAGLARNIRAAALTLLELENESGRLRQLHNAFQTALIHDLSEKDFADTYAQTITYGLLTAAINRTDMSGGVEDTTLHSEMLADVIPVTNPFLREMLQTFLKAGGRQGGIDFDELGIQDVVQLLRGNETDLPAVLRDFGNRTQGEDPVIHFYEHFLAAYDKQLKVQRGVFYTPKPVVSYIVRSVHELLQSEFGLADGLADTATWGEMAARLPDLNIPEGTSEDSPFVTILDPATGTATFLVEVIDVIHRALTEKWRRAGLNESRRKAAWNEYVPRHLLPRLHGYELMMAPYAIAHMKIGLKLHETGYRFGSEERVRVYLTNALEPADDAQMQMAGILPALAHEAQAVNRVKRDQRFTVVVGNPPYSGHSANKGEWIGQKLRDYYKIDGQPLGERNPKWLQDDYVKFIRLGQEFVSEAGTGVLSLITNHGYLDNPTFRGMRQQLLGAFSDLHILDLHGNTKKKETAPDGSKDENVFDIQQGVAICRMVKMTGRPAHSSIRHADLFGLRPNKYERLQAHTDSQIDWTLLAPQSPFYMYFPRQFDLLAEYERGWKVTDIFPINSVGIVTARDSLTIHFSEADIWRTVVEFEKLSVETARRKYHLGKDARDWKVGLAQEDIRDSGPVQSKVMPIQYRPFDLRFTYYTGQTRGFICMPRPEVMGHMRSTNIGFHLCRQIVSESWQHILVTNTITDDCYVSTKTRERGYTLPLYAISEQTTARQGLFAVLSDDRVKERKPNFAASFVAELATALGSGRSLAPEDIFQYIYAILHSPIYRDRYAEFLKIDFPRIPLTASRELFQALARLGGQLVALHLVEFALDDEDGAPADWPRYPRLAHFRGNDRTVSKFPSAAKAWADGYVAINQTSGFAGVPEKVWNFQIGGYQVCHKWLKDRKDRELSDEDLLHYAKIVTALHQTIRLMGEIDEVIDAHGGWPDAFVGE